jgi:predicted glutamine amidotransferase
LAATAPEHRAAIRGSTDSEHLFHLILSTHEAAPARPLLASLRLALERVIGWCRAIGQEPHLGLNVLLTDGERMVGSRWQRSLHYLERTGRRPCPVCGEPHAAGARDDYRALIVASEPITDEPWPEVPERSVFEINPEGRLRTLPLAAA